MVEIVLGMASSHAPQLEFPPCNWRAYGDLGRKQPQHWFEGKTSPFEELAELRAGSHFERECTEDKMQARWDACQKAIAHLAETLARIAPDVCVLVGDDQHESFQDENMPAISVYYGATVDDSPPEGERRALSADPRVANAPADRMSHPADAALGEHL